MVPLLVLRTTALPPPPALPSGRRWESDRNLAAPSDDFASIVTSAPEFDRGGAAEPPKLGSRRGGALADAGGAAHAAGGVGAPRGALVVRVRAAAARPARRQRRSSSSRAGTPAATSSCWRSHLVLVPPTVLALVEAAFVRVPRVREGAPPRVRGGARGGAASFRSSTDCARAALPAVRDRRSPLPLGAGAARCSTPGARRSAHVPHGRSPPRPPSSSRCSCSCSPVSDWCSRRTRRPAAGVGGGTDAPGRDGRLRRVLRGARCSTARLRDRRRAAIPTSPSSPGARPGTATRRPWTTRPSGPCRRS